MSNIPLIEKVSTGCIRSPPEMGWSDPGLMLNKGWHRVCGSLPAQWLREPAEHAERWVNLSERAVSDVLRGTPQRQQSWSIHEDTTNTGEYKKVKRSRWNAQ